MKRTKILAVAALMTAGLATPALADYVRLGSVDVGYRTDRDSTYSRFGGRMEGLRLTADRSNIMCRNIRVTYGDGSRDNVFSGVLREDQPVNVDLRGGARRVDRIDFTCRSDEFQGGKIYVNADVGHYRDEWQRSPDWVRVWASIFGGGYGGDRGGYGGGDRGGYSDRDWTSLGHARFEGRRQRENVVGWGGRFVDRIGLRAIDNDARCVRMTARFADGFTVDLNGADYLQRGRVVVLDLPGRHRNVVSVHMKCQAVRDRDVTIEVLTRH